MADYRATVQTRAPARQVFDYLVDPENLTRYVPGIVSVAPAGEDKLHVVAEVGDRQVEADGWMNVDANGLVVDWGAEGPDDYHGQMQLHDDGDGVTGVLATLSTAGAADEQIQQALEEALSRLALLTDTGV